MRTLRTFGPMCLAIVLIYIIHDVMAQCQGDLRLAGFFADQGSGRLEIFFNNQWGTICINGFARESADTACRQLGRSRALSFGEADELGFGQGNGTIHFSEVDCSDDDIHILHCDNNSSRISQCTHGDDVGLVCSGITAFQFTGGVRLVGGPYRSEGRLQLYFFNVWGGVCGRNFSTLEANAVCKRLGYTRSRGIREVSRADDGSPVWLTSESINCSSTRTCFSRCYRTPRGGTDLSSSCPLSTDIYISCEFTTPQSSRCLLTPTDPPFIPVLNNNGESSSSNNEDNDSASLAISIVVISVISGIPCILFICCCTCCYTCCLSVKKKCAKVSCECCCEGCLSFFRLFDVRRCFRHRERSANSSTRIESSDRFPQVVRERSPIELVELKIGPVDVGTTEPIPSRRCSEDNSNPGGDELPDYEHALNCSKVQGDDPEPSLVDDALPPPNCDIVN
ncbi:scavenger receptor cysteine-rich domain superfamily protein-like isoform X3 [Dysidea avara]|uniref:scavenger receptor cysteine-rich domain superfamily protein-like isoform X3 n=1 Tax=Dysidea avara TaxID=196820 RepID=UPI0033237B34